MQQPRHLEKVAQCMSGGIQDLTSPFLQVVEQSVSGELPQIDLVAIGVSLISINSNVFGSVALPRKGVAPEVSTCSESWVGLEIRAKGASAS